ncbi:MAG: transposase [Defluviitaleaceae bacterium]|nr:transposase [Defluviitaleaceae bacterium]
MIGDFLRWGEAINIALEVQKGKQEDYAVRGALTSGNAMRTGFLMGEDFCEVIFLPPYSPDLNPIEKSWAWLKQKLKSVLFMF